MLIKVNVLVSSSLLFYSDTVQNLVPGRLVNGSLGQVVGFSAACDAYKENVKFGLSQCLTDNHTSDGKEEKDGKVLSPCDPPEELFTTNRSWPIVRFSNGERLLCVPVGFDSVSASGIVEATRTQVSDSTSSKGAPH